MANWNGKTKCGQFGASSSFLTKQGQEVVCWICGSPHMKKECPNKGKAFTSKSRFSSVEKCEYYGVEGHDIDHYYSLHPKLHPNRPNNNKDVKGKGGCGGGNGFQSKGKATWKSSNKDNNKGKGGGIHAIIHEHFAQLQELITSGKNTYGWTKGK